MWLLADQIYGFMIVQSQNSSLTLQYYMGNQEDKLQQRQQTNQQLDDKIYKNIKDQRLRLSHQTNIWKICCRLKDIYQKIQITEIHLDNNMIAGEVIEVLSKINFQKRQPKLKLLSLCYNDIVCDNLKYFRGAFFNYLLMLYLDHNKIGSDGCYYLSKTLFAKLQTLDLSFNNINETGAAHLSNCNFPKLLNLLISNNELNEKSIHIFSKAEWPSLAFLQAKNNKFEPTIEMEAIKFRTDIKMFRLQLR